MANERNTQTRNLLTNEIKALEAQCKEHCYMIDNNSPMELCTITPSNCNDKKLIYVNSLAKSIQHDETPIITDSNVNTSMFLNELTEKLVHVEELTALTKAARQDVENETNRLRTKIKMVQEAKSRPWAGQSEVQPEHLRKAKQHFQTMKAELHGLIHSLFPDISEDITDLLGELMSQRKNEESSGYIEITPDKYDLIEILKDKNVVSTNPYNRMEVKLAF